MSKDVDGDYSQSRPECCQTLQVVFFFPVSHVVTELPPSQRWSWEEAPSRRLVSRKALSSGQQSTPCNIHHKHFQLKLNTYTPVQVSKGLDLDLWFYFLIKKKEAIFFQEHFYISIIVLACGVFSFS